MTELDELKKLNKEFLILKQFTIANAQLTKEVLLALKQIKENTKRPIKESLLYKIKNKVERWRV